MERDINLLFGVFAVQLNKVNAIQLMEAAGAWAVEPSRGIPERLVAARALSQGDRDLIQRIVDEAVAAHDGNAGQTLKSFGGDAQVHRSYRGSIVLTPDGQVSIPPTDVTPHGSAGSKSDPDIGSIKGVFETPGRYTNAIEHARGGMGRVLLVHDDYLGRDIALKELLPHLGEVAEATTRDRGAVSTEDGPPSPVRFSAHILARFLQEARITGQLEHPSIVPVYELGHRADGSLYYTMKLVRGRSLSKALGECKTLEERLRYLPHFVDLCQAIAYAHSRKIIHRDIKPANVMVGEFGETVVLDWGLAKRRDREDVHERELAETVLAMNFGDEILAARTAYGQVLGTPVYMPPEQAKGDLDQVDERSDVYSLGAVLYEILAGKRPFEGKSSRDVLANVIAGGATPVSTHAPDAPPELIAIVAKAMRLEKDGRYVGAKMLAEEIQRFQSGALVGAYAYRLRDLLKRYTDRHKTLVVGTFIGTMMLLLLFAVSYQQIVSERDQAQAARNSEANALKQSEEKVAELVRASYVANIRLAESHIERGEREFARARLLEAPALHRNWEWGNLFLSFDTSLRTMVGHGEGVNNARWSPDGRRIVTASYDTTARVWDAASGLEVCTFSGHGDQVLDAAWSFDGRWVITTSYDKTTRVWDAETGKERWNFPDHTGVVRGGALSLDGQRIATVMENGDIVLWSMESGAEVGRLTGHVGVVNSLSWSANDQRITTVSSDSVIRIWETDTGLEIARIEADEKGGMAASSSPDGHYVATSGWGSDKVNVWDVLNEKRIATFSGHGGGISGVRWSPNGRRLVTCSLDGFARVWDLASGTIVRTLPGSSAIWSPDSDLIAADNKVWEVESGKERLLLRGHIGAITSIDWSPDGQQVVTSSLDRTAKIWLLMAPKSLQTTSGQEQPLVAAAWSPDGKYAATISTANSNLVLWDTESGDRVRDLSEGLAWADRIAWSPDGRFIATVTQRSAKLWNVATGKETPLIDPLHVVEYVTWSPDSKQIVSISRGSVSMWNVEVGAEIRRLTGSGGQTTRSLDLDAMTRAAWSPDGKHIAVATPGAVGLLHIDSDEIQTTLTIEGKRLSGLFWSKNGQQIATVYVDHTVGIWDVDSGNEIHVLRGHTDPVNVISWSPDSQRLITASKGTVLLWDSVTGVQLRRIAEQPERILDIFWSLDGLRIQALSNSGTIETWASAPWNKIAP